MLAVADHQEMILGFKSVNTFLVKGRSHSPRLKAVARIVDRIEVFPLANRSQLLKITKDKFGL